MDPLEKLKELLVIESCGRDAADKGFHVDDNPYADGDSHIMWENGFLQEKIAIEYSKMKAVYAWAISSLEALYQTSSGKTQCKLDVVIGKMKEHLEDQDV